MEVIDKNIGKIQDLNQWRSGDWSYDVMYYWISRQYNIH